MPTDSRLTNYNLLALNSKNKNILDLYLNKKTSNTDTLTLPDYLKHMENFNVKDIYLEHENTLKQPDSLTGNGEGGKMKLSDGGNGDAKQYIVKVDIESVKKVEERIKSDFNISIVNIKALKNDEVLTDFLNETAILHSKYTEMYNAIIADTSMIGTRDIAWVTPSRELHINPYFFNSREAMADILDEFSRQKTIPKKCGNIEYISKYEYYHLITKSDVDDEKSLARALFRRTKPSDFVSKNSMIDPYEFVADFLSIHGDNKIKNKLKQYYGLEQNND